MEAGGTFLDRPVGRPQTTNTPDVTQINESGFAIVITRERVRDDGTDGGGYERYTYTTTWANIHTHGWRKNPKAGDPWYAGTQDLYILDLRRPKGAALYYLSRQRESKEGPWKQQVRAIPLRLDSSERAERFEDQLRSLLKRLLEPSTTETLGAVEESGQGCNRLTSSPSHP